MAAEPDEWGRFYRRTFGDPYMVWHEGPSFDGLLQAWATDPDHVSAMLTLGLTAQDPIAARGIEYLIDRADGSQRLGPALQAVLPQARGSFCIRVAEALYALTGDQRYADPICGVLAGREHWGVRIDAAIALGRFAASPSVVAALAGGVRDRDYLVRRHSAQSLLTLAGQPRTIENDTPTWALIERDGDRRSWRKAAKILTAPWET